MADLESVLADLAKRLGDCGVPYMVIGGMANAVWGYPRSTVDLDLAVLLDPGAASTLIQSLGKPYQCRVGNPEQFVSETRVLPMLHSGSVQIDLIFALLPFEEEAIERAVNIDVLGVAVRFCTPEDLVLHKIVSTRERDRQDVREILRRRRDSLDRSYLDPRVHELSVLLERPELEDEYHNCLDNQEA
ncbi:MAG: nucleotidyltransferase [Acidobacteriota bacterium]